MSKNWTSMMQIWHRAAANLEGCRRMEQRPQPRCGDRTSRCGCSTVL
jgi:hypothetical protein